MYRLVSVISLFLRTYLFPNPFTKVFEIYLTDTLFHTSCTIIADMFNLVAGGGLLCSICYPLVGIIYNKGEAPVVGSILYAIFVLLNSWLLSWAAVGLNESNLKIIILKLGICLIIETIILFGIRHFKNLITYRY